MLSLRVERNGETVTVVPLSRDVLKVGTLASCQVRLEGEGVARLHAVIERTEEGALVIDLGSRGGTRVNGARVNEAAVGAGDAIEVGGFRMVVERDVPDVQSVAQSVATPAPRAPACPHCRGWLENAFSTGGPYRGVALAAKRCSDCGLVLIDARDVAGFFDVGRDEAKRALLERKRERVRMPCGTCGGVLEQVSLSAQEAWVTFEECARCREILLEAGELEALRAVIAEAVGIED